MYCRKTSTGFSLFTGFHLPYLNNFLHHTIQPEAGTSVGWNDHKNFTYDSVVKGKAVPLQAWTGPEGSRKLRFPDFRDNGTGWW